MASIFRQKSGSYCIRVSNGYINGKQKNITTTYRAPEGLSAKAAEKAAKEYAKMFEQAVRDGTYVPGKILEVRKSNQHITLNEFVESYYYERIEIRMSPNSVVFYRSVIENCILPSFGKVRVCDISSEHLQAMIDFLASPGARANEYDREPLSAATIKRYATIFSSVMNEAYKVGYAEKDVLHKKYIVYPKIYTKPIQAYDDEEAQKFFTGLKEEIPEYRAMLLTSLLLGLRRGEVVGLMWSDFNFKQGYVNVTRSAYKVKGQPQDVKEPKSKSSVRKVYFSKAYEIVLMDWREEQLKEKEAAGDRWKEQGFVFTNQTGGMLCVSALTRICSRFEEKHGLRHLKLHGLRHTCASLMIKNGVDIETVKSLFGHENIRTTQQYLSAYESSKRSAAQLLSDAILKQEGDLP